MMGAMDGEVALRLRVDGPGVGDGLVPLRALERIVSALPQVVRELAVEAAQQEVPDFQPTFAREVTRASALALIDVLPGSAVLEFAFADDSETKDATAFRQRAVERLVLGLRDFEGHPYLPYAWTPKILRHVARLASAVDRDVEHLALRLPAETGRETAEASITRAIRDELTSLDRKYREVERARRAEDTTAYEVRPPAAYSTRPSFNAASAVARACSLEADLGLDQHDLAVLHVRSVHGELGEAAKHVACFPGAHAAAQSIQAGSTETPSPPSGRSEPMAISSRPSSPASNARTVAGLTRTTSQQRSSRISASSLTCPEPLMTT